MKQARKALVTQSPEETEKLGERLGRVMRAGDVACLTGNLGAGKTCLTRGIARGWGATDSVASPTFTLINEHRRPDGAMMAHVDCYRMEGARDVMSSGLEDALDRAEIAVIEWAERARDAMPDDAVWIAMEDRGDSRRAIRIGGQGERAGRLIKALGLPG